jgi:hypothetical protein
MGGEIGYISVKHLFGALTPEAAKANWSLESYMTQYGTVASVTKRLQASEWSRTLPEAICEGMQLLCCPEDFRCKHCTQGSLQLCEACEVPLCRKCLENMCKQNACAVISTGDGASLQSAFGYMFSWLQVQGSLYASVQTWATSPKVSFIFMSQIMNNISGPHFQAKLTKQYL